MSVLIAIPIRRKRDEPVFSRSSAMNQACPFCALPSERIIDANDVALVIRDGFPISPGHTLIIPRRHVGSFFEISAAEREGLLLLSK